MNLKKTEHTNHEDNDERKTNIYILYFVMSKIQLTSVFDDI
jgi:hypothetical protein